MPFQFSLEILLRFRRSIEQQQENLLQEANQQSGTLMRAIEAAQGSIQQVTAEDEKMLAGGASAAELQFDWRRREWLLHRRNYLEGELRKAQQLQDERQRSYHAAWQRRELVDTLRRQQFRAHQEEEARREQRNLDDLFLLRREFLRHQARHRG